MNCKNPFVNRRRIAAGIPGFGLALALLLPVWPTVFPAEPGREVAVVYNRQAGEDSALVAQFYAQARGVPDRQIIGLDLPTQETISRQQFEERLRRPLLRELETRGLVQFHGLIVPAQKNRPGRVIRVPQAASVRYLVLCWGVPLRISRDPNLVEPGQTNLPTQLRRNEAAVDSELAAALLLEAGRPRVGPIPNPAFGTTNTARLHPTQGLFLVARLDGPSPAIARRLVKLAVAAERDGLWGRAWFDLRGLKSGPYQPGDDWLREASEVAWRVGFETSVDEQAAVLPEGFPFPQVALYAGWYQRSVCGPLASPTVEFQPGAIAYHLHSFSATTIRSPNAAWVGPLLARGVTATFGHVYEPYLSGSPRMGILFQRLLEEGFTLGEAFYAAQPALSWQNTLVGDPLYRPAAWRLAHGEDPAAAPPAFRPWAVLQSLNHRLAAGLSAAEARRQLENHPLTSRSAILLEKLAALLAAEGRWREAAKACERALDQDPSPEQAVLLQIQQARYLAEAGRLAEALKAWEQFFDRHPDRPGLLPFYEEAHQVAVTAGKRRLEEEFARAIERLRPPPATTATNTPGS